ncbi:MAG: EMC3/TMCO1 family protein [Candidatus Micrarchaeia archaeon]
MDTSVMIIISVTAVISSFAITYVLKKLNISTRMQEIQKFNNELNKEYFKALAKKDMKKLDELEPKLKESQKNSFELLKLQFMSLAILLPFAMLVPPFIQSSFSNFTIILPFQIPVPFRPTLFSVTFRDTFGAYGWFWLSFIFLGGFAQLLVGKIKGKEKKN